jgi:sulfate permease, SulP family
MKHSYEVDANAELRGFGVANLLAGVSSSFPGGASGSRTAVNDDAGGQSQVVGLTAAVVVGLFLLFLMPLIEPLPKAALGVIVVVAALGLIDVRSVWRLRHVRPEEVGLAVAAFAGVLVLGVVGGVAVAIALSIGVFLYRAARPHDAVLGRVVDVDGYHDIERWEDAETLPGLIVYRFDAPVFFVNSEHLRQRVLALVEGSDGLEWLVLNAEAWVYLDATGVDSLRQLKADLAARDVRLVFARLKGRQREIFRETGLMDEVGEENVFPTVRSAVAAFESRP